MLFTYFTYYLQQTHKMILLFPLYKGDLGSKSKILLKVPRQSHGVGMGGSGPYPSYPPAPISNSFKEKGYANVIQIQLNTCFSLSSTLAPKTLQYQIKSLINGGADIWGQNFLTRCVSVPDLRSLPSSSNTTAFT